MSAVSGVSSANEIQANYMKLLVTQMQNQNPLEPMSNDQMASQMAQFSQLQQLENMNGSFSQVLGTSKLTYANSLVGKYVAFKDTQTGALNIGKVDYAVKEADGTIKIKVGGTKYIDIDQVQAVANDQGSFGLNTLG